MDRFLEEVVSKRERMMEEILYWASLLLMVITGFFALMSFMFLSSAPNLIMGIIGSYQVFSLSYVTTNGGPVKSTYFYMLYLYETAFGQMRMGYASALAWILTVIIAVSTAIAYAFSNRFAYYES